MSVEAAHGEVVVGRRGDVMALAEERLDLRVGGRHVRGAVDARP